MKQIKIFFLRYRIIFCNRNSNWYIYTPFMERCRSGLTGTPGKRVYGKPYRGFESHSLRKCFTHIFLKVLKMVPIIMGVHMITYQDWKNIIVEKLDTLRRIVPGSCITLKNIKPRQKQLKENDSLRALLDINGWRKWKSFREKLYPRFSQKDSYGGIPLSPPDWKLTCCNKYRNCF